MNIYEEIQKFYKYKKDKYTINGNLDLMPIYFIYRNKSKGFKYTDLKELDVWEDLMEKMVNNELMNLSYMEKYKLIFIDEDKHFYDIDKRNDVNIGKILNEASKDIINDIGFGEFKPYCDRFLNDSLETNENGDLILSDLGKNFINKIASNELNYNNLNPISKYVYTNITDKGINCISYFNNRVRNFYNDSNVITDNYNFIRLTKLLTFHKGCYGVDELYSESINSFYREPNGCLRNYKDYNFIVDVINITPNQIDTYNIDKSVLFSILLGMEDYWKNLPLLKFHNRVKIAETPLLEFLSSHIDLKDKFKMKTLFVHMMKN